MTKSTEGVILPFEATQALAALGGLLSRARRAREDTQAVAAERCGLHKQTVARIEKGDPTVGIGKVFALMATYDMSPRLFAMSEPDEVTEILYRKHLPARGRGRSKSK